MKNIVINYKILKDISQDVLEKIVTGCYSQKYKIFLNLYDFSLSKNTAEYIKTINVADNINISYSSQNYEDIQESDNIILYNLIQHGDSLSFGIFADNLIFNQGAMDGMDFEALADETNGFLYFDYNIKNIRCFLRSRSVNVQINVPAIFWSTSKLIRHIPQKDKLNIVGNNYGSIHIPHSMCTIYPDEK